jgi:hypothetical protein
MGMILTDGAPKWISSRCLSSFITRVNVSQIRAQAYVGGVYRDQGADVASNWLISLLRPHIEVAYRSMQKDHLLPPDAEAPQQLETPMTSDSSRFSSTSSEGASPTLPTQSYLAEGSRDHRQLPTPQADIMMPRQCSAEAGDGVGAHRVVIDEPLEPRNLGSSPLAMAYHASIPSPAPNLSMPSPIGYQNQSYAAIPFVRSEGFLTKMFGRRDAAFFIESLLKVDVRDVYLVGNVPGWRNALMSQKSSIHDARVDAIIERNNQPLWLLDIIPPPMYHVVPQQIWTPPNQSDWRRYVEQTSLRMPVFFIQNDGAIGLPLARALAGDRASLRDADMPAPLGGGHSTQIRIAVSTSLSSPLQHPPSSHTFPIIPPPPPLRLSFLS